MKKELCYMEQNEQHCGKEICVYLLSNVMCMIQEYKQVGEDTTLVILQTYNCRISFFIGHDTYQIFYYYNFTNLLNKNVFLKKIQ